jgi:NAD kinase
VRGVERKVVLVSRATRLDELLRRHQTLEQARYAVERLGGDFSDYLAEHRVYADARTTLVDVLSTYGRYQVVDRTLLPNFIFAPDDVVVAMGQDGVVANTMKYLDGQPLVGINPDAARFDGVLLPFEPGDFARVLPEVVADRRPARAITMAEASLSDGQSLLAVNDFFVGPRTHTSARYEISLAGRSEVQSSSGIIVCTGLGSTAWMRSVVTGALAVAGTLRASPGQAAYEPFAWDAARLQFAVREPFPSRSSQATLVYGAIDAAHALEVRSLMGGNGVIFSDGLEADYLEFNAGVRARVAVSRRVGRLVV